MARRRRRFRSVIAPALLAAGLLAAGSHQVVLVEPSIPVAEAWRSQAFGVPTRYENRTLDGRPVIAATGEGSASGLIRGLRFRVADHPLVTWSWRVDTLPAGADIRTREGDDVGASLFLLFGRSGWFRPDPPTLVYAWTTAATPASSVVVSPYHQGNVRSLVLRSGAGELGQWVVERRDLAADYRRVFGAEPPVYVEAVALWSDADQTGGTVRAYYGKVVAGGR